MFGNALISDTHSAMDMRGILTDKNNYTMKIRDFQGFHKYQTNSCQFVIVNDKVMFKNLCHLL